MTYSTIRADVTAAKNDRPEDAIAKLADAIVSLTKTIEQDIERLEKRVNFVTGKVNMPRPR